MINRKTSFVLRRLALPLAAVLMTSLTAPALASSLPRADQNGQTLSLGSAPSLAADFSLTPQWAAGFSLAMPFYYGSFGFLRYDLRSSYVLLEKDALTLRGIAGFYGDVNTQSQSTLQLAPFGIQAGIGLSYRFNEFFTGRLNIAAGISFPRATGLGLFPPIGGLELAFRPYQNFEASVGFNGNGDILAISYLF